MPESSSSFYHQSGLSDPHHRQIELCKQNLLESECCVRTPLRHAGHPDRFARHHPSKTPIPKEPEFA